MVGQKNRIRKLSEIFFVFLTLLTHLIPFYFIIVNAAKSNKEAARMSLAFPEEFQLFENLKYVFSYRSFAIVKAFWNSFQVTLFSILIVIIVSSMAAFFLQRRRNERICRFSDNLLVACLTVPAAVVPTYYILTILHVNNTMTGLILVEVASLFPFCTMFYKTFIATIPAEIDEAGALDGCNAFQLFWHIIFPILKPTTSAIIVLRSIIVFNDFQNAQYYLSGSKSLTIQVCIHNFKSAFGTKWAYVFMASILASIPLIILYILFNKQFLQGTTEGSVKG